MKCDKISILLPDYARGDLDDSVMLRVREHLAACPGCSKELEFYVEYSNIVSGLKSEKAPKDLLFRIHQKISGEKASMSIGEHIKKLSDTLFQPFRIKIPLEALGLLLVSVIIYILYSPDQYLKKGAPEQGIVQEPAMMKSGKIYEDRKASAPVYKSRDDGFYAKKEIITEKQAEREKKSDGFREITLNIMPLNGDVNKKDMDIATVLDEKTDEKAPEKAYKAKAREEDKVSGQYSKQYLAKKSAGKIISRPSASWNKLVQNLRILIKKHNGIIVNEQADSETSTVQENRVRNIEIRISPENYGPLMIDLNKIGKVSESSKSYRKADMEESVNLRIKSDSIQSK